MAEAAAARQHRPGWGLWAGASGLIALAVMFAFLGQWQLQRLDWKRDLMSRIALRLAAEPQAAPDIGATVSRADHEYRRVRLHGAFDHGREVLVGASTVLGAGHWLMTPMQLTDGRWVWINRGFVPRRDTLRQRPDGQQVVEGLLRLSEPGGSLLQRNDPVAHRWYSRDVPALSAAAGLERVATFFVDVWPEPPSTGAMTPAVWPHPGLTVLNFSNNHRGYALTWFALAAMALGGAAFLLRQRGLAQPHDPE